VNLGTAGYVQLAEVIAKQQPVETDIKVNLFRCLHTMTHTDKHTSFDYLGLLVDVIYHVKNCHFFSVRRFKYEFYLNLYKFRAVQGLELNKIIQNLLVTKLF